MTEPAARCGDCGVPFTPRREGRYVIWSHPGECSEDERARQRYNEGHTREDK